MYYDGDEWNGGELVDGMVDTNYVRAGNGIVCAQSNVRGSGAFVEFCQVSSGLQNSLKVPKPCERVSVENKRKTMLLRSTVRFAFSEFRI